MSTAMKTSTGLKGPKHGSPTKEQLRHDRIVGIVVLVLMVALFGLMIWLASITGGAPPADFDAWPMMY